MSLGASMLPEFDHEMTATRRVLERVPADRFGWKPHAKSWTMGELAAHLANIPSWTSVTVERDSFDMSPAGEPPPRTPPVTSPLEARSRFDANVSAAREVIAAASDVALLSPWTLLAGGKAVFSLPRIAVLRRFVFSHVVHHRAQLGLYLRLNDIPVPNIYGPSADES
jgi:uncharacterized damage-inducible protein DinB